MRQIPLLRIISETIHVVSVYTFSYIIKIMYE